MGAPTSSSTRPTRRQSSWPRYRVLRSDPEHKRFELVDTEIAAPGRHLVRRRRRAGPRPRRRRAQARAPPLRPARGHQRRRRGGPHRVLQPHVATSRATAQRPATRCGTCTSGCPRCPDGGGPGWDPTPIPITPLIDGLVDCATGSIRTMVADIDGDGASEIVVQARQRRPTARSAWRASKWIEIPTNLPSSRLRRKIHFLDVNGDGLSDALYTGFGLECDAVPDDGVLPRGRPHGLRPHAARRRPLPRAQRRQDASAR